MLNFEEKIDGWATAGDLLTLIAQNQLQIESYLELSPGSLDPWIAEFDQPKKPDLFLRSVEFYVYREIDFDDDLNTPADVSWHICGELQESATALEQEWYARDGRICYSEWSRSPLEYWHLPVIVNKTAKDFDCRDLNSIVEKTYPVEIILGQIIYAWYDGITWGGEKPEDRQAKIQALTGTWDRVRSGQQQTIEYQSDNPEAKYKIRMTEQVFDLLSDSDSSGNN